MIQAISNNKVKYKVSKGNDYAQWAMLAVLYVLAFIVEDGQMAFPVRLAVGIGFVLGMFTSYANAVAITMMALFIPFIGNVLGQEISGLKLPRLVILVFLYLSWYRTSVRRLQFNKQTLFLLLFSTFLIIVFADIQVTLQTVPLSEGQTEAKGFKNFIAQFIDQLFIVVFFLIAFVKLNYKQIHNLYNVFILIAVFTGLNILYMFALHPEKVFFGAGFDKLYLWQSTLFGHKNDWGMMFVFMFFITFVRYFMEKENKILYLIAMGIFVTAIAISLSRQAYIWLVLGFILISVWQKNTKIMMYFVIGIIALAIIQPAFIIDRMESMVAVDSLEDAKNINRKISDLSIDQAVSYFTFVPRVFVIEWEYNWSEGFWVGLLHNTGIIGFFSIIYIYFKFFLRYRLMFKTNHKKLSTYGVLMMTFLVLMFLANLNRRWTHFVHYDGNIGQIGFIVMFIMFYAELLFSSLKKKVPFVQNM